MNAFENYCLILSAIEDNLAEFKQLKETLEQVKNSEQKRKTYCFFQILHDIKKLNEQQPNKDGAEATEPIDDPEEFSVFFLSYPPALSHLFNLLC